MTRYEDDRGSNSRIPQGEARRPASQGRHRNGYVRSRLERELASLYDLTAEHLTKKQIERIEEAMNADDLEVMGATVDAIVGRRRLSSMQKGRRAS